MRGDFNDSANDKLRSDTFDAITPIHLGLFETIFDLANERGGAKLIADDRFQLLQRMLSQHQALELTQKDNRGSEHYLPRLWKLDRQIMATTYALARDYLNQGLFDMLTHTTEATPLIQNDLRQFPEMKDYADLFERKMNGPRRGLTPPAP